MEIILLLVVLIGGPIVIVGGVQTLIWKLIGVKALRVVSAFFAVGCAFLLITEAFAPPVYGNKSGLIGLGTLAIGILMVENLLILCAPLMRRFVSWERNIEAR